MSFPLHTSIPLNALNRAEGWRCSQCGRTIVIHWPDRKTELAGGGFAATETEPGIAGYIHHEYAPDNGVSE